MIRQLVGLLAGVERLAGAGGELLRPPGGGLVVPHGPSLAAGVTSILNFAPLVLNVPQGVDVRKVDLSIELQILAFHAQRRVAERFGQEAESAAEA